MRKLLFAVLSLCLAVWLLWTFGGKPTEAATTVALAPVPYMEFVDAGGAPLSLGCVYSFAAGTTTPLATFSDSTENVPNSDPIQLDASGSASIWLTGSAYKLAWYKNISGGACPGTPGGGLTLIKTVDNITTATSSGSGAATSLTSAAANPATAGIIRMAKSDTVCWRNAGNAGNLCVSLDANNILTWAGGSLAMTEIAAPSGVVAAEDIIWADSTAHRWKVSNNAGAAVQLVVSGADINTSDQVTATHLASALPTAQGGTGSTSASTGSGGVVLQNSPTIGSANLSTSSFTPNGSFANGTAFQISNAVGTGSVAPAAGFALTVTWPVTWNDTNYFPVCFNDGSFFVAGSAFNKTTTTTDVNGINAGAGSGSANVYCIAFHN